MTAKEIGFESMKIMPPRPGTCPECAVEHAPDMPHNKDSLYYQMKFRQKNGRFASWEDAMAHCSETMKAYWRQALAERGVDAAQVPGETRIQFGISVEEGDGDNA